MYAIADVWDVNVCDCRLLCKDGENIFVNKGQANRLGLWMKNMYEERKLALIALNVMRHCR